MIRPRNVDEGVEGGDRLEARGSEVKRPHVALQERDAASATAGERELRPREVDRHDVRHLGERERHRNAGPAAEVEHAAALPQLVTQDVDEALPHELGTAGGPRQVAVAETIVAAAHEGGGI